MQIYFDAHHMKLAQTFALHRLLLSICLAALIIVSSCSEDDEPAPPAPTVSELEIGSGNNGIGVIGRDFHLNAEVEAGDKIEYVQIKIVQRADQEYAAEWSFELSWEEFKGAKNATVHKHFDIPEDAVEGFYDFILIVNDENGSSYEETFDFEIKDPANLPVNPYLYTWYTSKNDAYLFFVNESLENPEGVTLTKGDTLKSDVLLKDVKGDGTIYLVLIKKDQNYLPETVDVIDFSKVIVYDKFEHKDQEEVDSFGNIIYDGQGGYERESPKFSIGASEDNNSPQPTPIQGDISWENGAYYFGVIYTNSTYDMSVHHYMELNLEGF